MTRRYTFIPAVLIGMLLLIASSAFGAIQQPEIDIYEPDNNSVAFNKYVYIKGRVKNTSKLTINGSNAKVDAHGNFTHRVTLDFFGYHYIKLVASNKFDLKRIKYLHISYRKLTDKPTIAIIRPKENTKVGVDYYVVKGVVENVSKLFLDKKSVDIKEKNGKHVFEIKVHLLVIGNNRFVFRGFSNDNQEIQKEVIIERVNTYTPGQDVKLDIFFPVEGLETKKPKIAVKGQALNIKRLYVNDQLTKVNKKNIFYTEIPLQYGSNTIEIIGVDGNEVPTRMTRKVLRLSKDMEKQKSRSIKIESSDANRKLVSFDHVFTEKDRQEKQINTSIQEALNKIVGEDRVVFSAMINLNTEKIKDSIDSEYDGKINAFIKSVDMNVLLDRKLRNKKEKVVKKIVRDQLSHLKGVRQKLKFSYESFTAGSPVKVETPTDIMSPHLLLIQQQTERKIQDFFQDYLDQMLGLDNAYVYVSFHMDKKKIRNASLGRKGDWILDDISNYTSFAKVTVLLDTDLKDSVEPQIKELFTNNISNFGPYLLQVGFLYENFKRPLVNDQQLGLMFLLVLLAGVLCLFLISMIREKRMEKKQMAFLERMQALQVRAGVSGTGGSMREGLSSLKVRGSGLPQGTTAESEHFSFINEENIHKLLLVLAIQIGQDQASTETISIIVAHLDPDLAARVLMQYPPKIQAEILNKMVEPVQYDVAKIESIETEIQNLMTGTIGGKAHVLGIIDSFSQASARYVFKEIQEKFPSTYESIKSNILLFEDILNLEDQELEVLFREIDPQDIAAAVHGLDLSEVNRIESLLSETVQLLVDEWRELRSGKVKEDDIEQARKRIIDVAKVLDNYKSITIKK